MTQGLQRLTREPLSDDDRAVRLDRDLVINNINHFFGHLKLCFCFNVLMAILVNSWHLFATIVYMHIVCHHNTHTCKWLFSPSTVDFLPNSTVCPPAWSVHRTLSHRMFITCYYFPIDCNHAWQGRWIACLHVDEGAAELESTTVYRYIHVYAWFFVC